ncbi:MAG: type II secretion system protein [Candidatus Eutrophobiaceae bacterium]
MNAKQQGFTLIEIAIVLVIIGLLIGGMLKGQELINGAKVRNLAQQGASVQAAWFGFVDRYGAIPGDSPASQISAAIGEEIKLPANGSATASNGQLDNTLEEAAAVWEHLAKSKFLSGGFVPASAAPASSAAYSQHAPRNAFNGVLVLSQNQGFTGVASKRLNLHLGRNVPAAIASELDRKIDDGKPNTGLLRLSNRDGTSAAFDSDLFAPQYASCTTAQGATSSGNAAGSNIATDIYDMFDKESDCQPVLLIY